jgi:hypothetical protein
MLVLDFYCLVLVAGALRGVGGAAEDRVPGATRASAWARVPTLRMRAVTFYFICGNANSTPALAVFGQRCITALWRV